MNDQLSPCPPAAPFTVIRDALGLAAPPDAALNMAVLALGNFEGVHRGHRVVIDAALARARALGRPAAAMTFEPHPRAFFNPNAAVFRLTDVATKLRLLASTGLDGAIVMEFDADLARLTPEAFVADVLVQRYAVAGIVVGYDFHFGKGRTGTPAFLTASGDRLGFAVDVVSAYRDGDQRISSGAIREALIQGDVKLAARLLGYPWFVTGQVVHGDKRGRALGFPTANIRLDPQCGLRHGVYAVRVDVDGRRYDGVANFGRRPMFDSGVVLLEVFLFDFAGDLYGKTLDVAFIAWIRPELKFDAVAELVRRMEDDCHVARAELAQANSPIPPLAEVG